MTESELRALPWRSLASREMSNEEREAHIKSCGLLLLKAHREGDIEEARHWLELQNEAIKSRSPEMVAHLEDCYFISEGQRARGEALARGAN